MRTPFLCAVVATLLAADAVAQLPAFSGAEGPGATATGGRGGDVYHVTNLEFDLNGVIPGSLKYGINNAPATGRTIVFDVGGTIYHDGGGAGWWFRSGKSNITVAGQTAPGPGITIAGVGSKWTGDNVILRNVTVRPNKDPVNPTSFTYDSFSSQLSNSVIDHVSASWFSDEGISQTDAGYSTTIQYALINEGLNYDSHSFGSIIATEVDGANLSYHHNLYAQDNSRMPRLGSVLGQTGAVTNFSNNVIYNWINRAGYSGTDQPSSTNFLGNYYIKGNNNGTTLFTGGDSTTLPGMTKIYQAGNLYDSNKNGVFDGTAVTNANFAGSKLMVSTAFNVAGVGALDTAAAALNRVLDYGGANWTNRNPIEQRVVQGVRTGTGALINDLTTGTQATEWATVLSQQATAGVAPFSRAANWDTDADGMPDVWEGAHGLNAAAADNNGDFDSDGYTNLEEYVNEIAEWPAPGPVVFGNGLSNGRFAQIQNWNVTGQQVNVAGIGTVTSTSHWQPSRFDEAQINAGTVSVDAVGQHAGRIVVAAGAGNVANLTVSAGWLVVEDKISLGGAPTAQGALNLTGGLLRTGRIEKGAAGQLQLTGGTLSADEIAFSVVNSGSTLSPGVGVGTTHVSGNLVMASGAISLEIAGATTGQFDRVTVDGQLGAGGTLDVTLQGYSPQLGDSFDLLDFSSAVGSWSVMLPALTAGLAWDPANLLTTGVLAVVASPTANADFNGDHLVDGADFLIWQRGLGLNGQTSNANGDANGDGQIDAGDLLTWQGAFGAAVTVSVSAAVPEPASAALLGFVGMLAAALRFRTRHRTTVPAATKAAI